MTYDNDLKWATILLYQCYLLLFRIIKLAWNKLRSTRTFSEILASSSASHPKSIGNSVKTCCSSNRSWGWDSPRISRINVHSFSLRKALQIRMSAKFASRSLMTGGDWVVMSPEPTKHLLARISSRPKRERKRAEKSRMIAPTGQKWKSSWNKSDVLIDYWLT